MHSELLTSQHLLLIPPLLTVAYALELRLVFVLDEETIAVKSIMVIKLSDVSPMLQNNV